MYGRNSGLQLHRSAELPLAGRILMAAGGLIAASLVGLGMRVLFTLAARPIVGARLELMLEAIVVGICLVVAVPIAALLRKGAFRKAAWAGFAAHWGLGALQVVTIAYLPWGSGSVSASLSFAALAGLSLFIAGLGREIARWLAELGTQ